MGVAQRLYEGVETGAGRIDGPDHLHAYRFSTRIRRKPSRAHGSGLGRTWARSICPTAPNTYKGKKDAQDAHEAIRPTDAARTPESIAKYLSDEQLKLYRLIWQRFVASQMPPAIFDITTANIAAVSRTTRQDL